MDYRPDPLNNGAFPITADFIIQCLSEKFYGNEVLSRKLTSIGQSVRAGFITTVRRFELAVLQAGKVSYKYSLSHVRIPNGTLTLWMCLVTLSSIKNTLSQGSS